MFSIRSNCLQRCHSCESGFIGSRKHELDFSCCNWRALKIAPPTIISYFFSFFFFSLARWKASSTGFLFLRESTLSNLDFVKVKYVFNQNTSIAIVFGDVMFQFSTATNTKWNKHKSRNQTNNDGQQKLRFMSLTAGWRTETLQFPSTIILSSVTHPLGESITHARTR